MKVGRAGALLGLLLLGGLAALELSSPAPLPRPPVVERRYALLLQGRRFGALEVVWTRERRDGMWLVRDVTRRRTRQARMMGQVRDVFDTVEVTEVLRTRDGDLLSMRTTVRQGGREDTVEVERRPGGYGVRRSVGGAGEAFAIPTDGPAKLDAEAFLGERVAAGEARPGTSWTCRLLDVERRRLVEARLEVVGDDPEGPGVKVVETVEGARRLWWFDGEGAAVRFRDGDVVVQRDDRAALDDLPARPAAYRVTLEADRDLPRLFDTREMLVALDVERDETVDLPPLEPSPFTEVVAREGGTLTLRLRCHDVPGAAAARPVADPRFEEFLRSTPLLESDHPEVRAVAREVVGDATDVRAAASRIGGFVFRALRKGSPDITELSAREILRRRQGDCSEHATLFLALCRAAGIPARRCSGVVCAGDLWGTHAWAEIWVGAWIGVDPTTNEVGTRARYILCAREGDRDRTPAAILAERTTLRILRAVYDDGALDFASGETVDEEVLSGIRLAADGWSVRRAQGAVELERAGAKVFARLHPDHGYRDLEVMLETWNGARAARFGGRPALRWGGGVVTWLVPLGRHNLQVRASRGRGALAGDDEIAALFQPTLEREEG